MRRGFPFLLLFLSLCGCAELQAHPSQHGMLTHNPITWNLSAGASHTASLAYAYDARGQLTAIQSSNPNGTQLTYSYDPLRRLDSVVDPRLGTTSYRCDPEGNLVSWAYPNGVTTTNRFDSLNRLTNRVSHMAGTRYIFLPPES